MIKKFSYSFDLYTLQTVRVKQRSHVHFIELYEYIWYYRCLKYNYIVYIYIFFTVKTFCNIISAGRHQQQRIYIKLILEQKRTKMIQRLDPKQKLQSVKERWLPDFLHHPKFWVHLSNNDFQNILQWWPKQEVSYKTTNQTCEEKKKGKNEFGILFSHSTPRAQ